MFSEIYNYFGNITGNDTTTTNDTVPIGTGISPQRLQELMEQINVRYNNPFFITDDDEKKDNKSEDDYSYEDIIK